MSQPFQGFKIAIAFLFIIAVLLIVLELNNSDAKGKTITVDDDGPANYDNIQDAINAAEEGDEIRVKEGSYDPFYVTKRVNIIGSGWESTEVSDVALFEGIEIDADNVNLSGFHIHHSRVIIHSSGNTISYNNISISGLTLNSDTHHNTIHNNVFHSNNEGVLSDVNSHNNTITRNRFVENDYGFLCCGSNDFIIRQNSIVDSLEAGIYFEDCEDFIIQQNVMTGNRFGIQTEESPNTNISFNIIQDNTFGAISLHDADNNEITRNILSRSGYGIGLMESGGAWIANNSITDNTIGISANFPSSDSYAQYNNIVGNTMYGVSTGDEYTATFNASYNWWGDDSGPYNDTENPDGEGDEITADDVEFITWLEDPILLAVIKSISPDPAHDDIKVRFEGFGIGEEINYYVWRSSIDGEFYGGVQTSFENDKLSKGSHTIYLKVRQKSGNKWSEEVSSTLFIHDRPIPKIEDINPDDALDTDDIFFRGSGTDSGTIERYAWRSSIDGEFYNYTEAEFYYDGLSNGTHLIYLKVMDNYGGWSDEIPDNLKIQGRPVSHIEDMSPNPALWRDNVTIRGYGSDDGSIERMVWSSSISGILNDGMNETIWNDSLPVGEHLISLMVQDDKGVWSYEVSAMLIITLRPEAFIDSILPNPALDTEVVHLEGHGIDVDGTIEQFAWRSSIHGEIYNGTDPFLDTPDLANGTHIISFKVMDNYGIWSNETNKNLTVLGKPRARIVSIFPNPAIHARDVFFRGMGTDDGVIERYVWRSSIDGEFYNGTIDTIYVANLSLGIHNIYMKVRDDDFVWSDEVSKALTITLIPNASIDLVNPNPAFDTETVRFVGSGVDDGTIERYAWRSSIDGEFYNDTESEIDYRGLSNGTHDISLSVVDNYGFWSEEVNITLTIFGKPQAFIDTISPKPAGFTQMVTFKGHGTDDGIILGYSWRSSIDGEFYNATSNMTLFGNLSRGHHDIYFKVMDDTGFWSEEVESSIIVSDIPLAYIDSVTPNPALHVDTIHFEGHGTDNGNIERYAWRSDVDGEFYNGTEKNSTAFYIYEGFEDLNISYETGGYVEWAVTNNPSYEGSQCAMNGDVDDDEFSWMETTFPWPGTLEFYWKVSSEDSDFLKFYVNGELEDQISGEVDWTRYSISFGQGGQTVRWRYEKDDHISRGDDTGYVDAIRYTTNLTLTNGTHNIYFRVMDNEGFWSTESSTILEINGKPMIQSVMINPNPAFHDEIINFNTTVIDDGNITHYVWWSTKEGREIYNGSSPFFSMTNLSNGTHGIILRIRDDFGTWSYPVEEELQVWGRPFAYIDYVTPFFSLETERVFFEGHGIDDGSIKQYEWISTIDGEVYNGTESKFNTTTLSTGPHTLNFRVKDNKGFWSDPVSTSIIVNGVPMASIDIVNPNPALDTDDITFMCHATDDGTIVRYVWRSSQDGEFYNNTGTEFTSDSLSLGNHSIYLKVQDNYGTWSTETGIGLTITLKPKAVIQSVNPNPALHTDRIFFKAGYIDDGTVIIYQWTSSLDGQIYSGNLSEFNSTSLRNGTHNIMLRVRDDYSFWSDFVSTSLDINGIPYGYIEDITPSFATDRDTIQFTGDELDDGTITTYRWISSIDGLLSGEKSFSSSDLSNGTHIIYFDVQDDHGEWSEVVERSITINGVPSVRITGIVPDPANEDTAVWIYGNASDDGTIIEYSWLSDIDGPIGNTLTFNTLELSNGTHLISFRVRDNDGQWSDTVTDTVTINGLPIARIDEITPGSIQPANQGDVVWFTGSGSDDGTIEEYSWRSSFSGLMSNQPVFSLTDFPNGTHTIYFKVKDDSHAWSEEVSMDMEVNGIPVAIIDNITPNPGVVTQKISLFGNASDDGTIMDYHWRSSLDGQLNSMKSFSRSDLSVGVHTIYLKVRDNHNVWSPETSMSLIVNHKPHAIIINIIPAASNSGDEISFFGRGTVEDANIVDYMWESSLNGYLSNQKEFTYSSLSNGTHTIEFKVKDDKGIWSDTNTSSIHVNGLPVAIIENVSAVDIIEGETVNFTGDGTDGGTIVGYLWTSSLNGRLYEGENKSFITDKLENGTHSITLKVLDNDGAWSPVVSTQVRVNGIPRARIAHISKNPAPEGHNIFFRAEGRDDGDVVRYVWRSSLDGELYDGTDPELRIGTLKLGNHTISLKVQDDEGVWSDEVKEDVVIKEKEDEGISWILVIGGVAAVVVIVLVVIFLIVLPRRRSDEEGGMMAQTGGQQLPQVPGQPPQTGAQPAGPMPAGTTPPGPPVPSGAMAGTPGAPPAPVPGVPQQTIPGQPTIPGPGPQMVPGMVPPVASGPVPPGPQPAGAPLPQTTTIPQQPPGTIPFPPQTIPPVPPGTVAVQPGTLQPPQPVAPAPQQPPVTPPQQPPSTSGETAPTRANWFCPKCGKEVAERFIFCTTCGFKRGA